MFENHNEIEIEATLKKAWEVLTDFEKYPEWNPLLIKVEGNVAPGIKVNVLVKNSPKNLKLICEVVKIEPLRELTWKFNIVLPFLFQGIHSFSLEAINDKNVRFIDRETFRGLLLPLQEKTLKTTGKADMIAMDRAFKDRLEKK